MQTENSNIGSYKFVAEPFLVDFTGHLTVGMLGNHLLNCAGFHATARGFGIPALEKLHCTWVLSRLAVEMDRMPCQYETFTVETWVENFYRLFTNRNFAVLDETGSAIGYARTIWAVIDLDTRKPVDLPAEAAGRIADYLCGRPCPIEKPSRMKAAALEPADTLPVRYSDIDINGHVNSIRYIEHILDLFPLEMYRRRRVRRFEATYVAESRYGDSLAFYKQQTGEDIYEVELRKNGAESVCRAKIVFADAPAPSA
ncbi:MAG: thioesterase [Prevotellaceae bacterium]|nr:thioesterase [Prevotellaceae bacterium]